MDRRTFLGSALGSLASAAVLSELTTGQSAVAANSNKSQSAKAGDALVFTAAPILKQLAAVAEKASHCANAGRACIEHCQEELIQGHAAEFARCAQTSLQMVPLCEAVASLAAYKATVISQVLAACISACDTCASACKEHEAHFAHGMHLACKACMQSCLDCKAECEKLQRML